jgi:uncharacterized membrane protein
MRHLATAMSTIVTFLSLSSAAFADITVCNESPATIHVAFANQDAGSYTAAGWWTVAPDACQDVQFTLQGDTLYYTADSDSYKSGRYTKRDHWGNKLKLFVGRKTFSFSDADKRHPGTKAEMFSSATKSQQPPGKDVAISVHFKPGGTTVVFTTKN